MSFDKEQYWKNRSEGKAGQGKFSSKKILAEAAVPNGSSIGFDNEGRMILKNRAYRRQRVMLAEDKAYVSQKTKRKLRKKK